MDNSTSTTSAVPKQRLKTFREYAANWIQQKLVFDKSIFQKEKK